MRGELWARNPSGHLVYGGGAKGGRGERGSAGATEPEAATGVNYADADADFEGNSALSESMMHKIREFTADPHHYAARHGPGGAELQVPGGCSPQDVRPQNVPASTERNGA